MSWIADAILISGKPGTRGFEANQMISPPSDHVFLLI
jgi:hypothetical protein